MARRSSCRRLNAPVLQFAWSPPWSRTRPKTSASMAGGFRPGFSAVLLFTYRMLDFCRAARCHDPAPRHAFVVRQEGGLLYRFDDYVLDTDRRELRQGHALVRLPP